jgi:arylsulfatase A-like enzyme
MPTDSHSGKPRLTRRGFAATLGAGALAPAAAKSLPNLLWITSEDMGPHIGPYGDAYATTPHLDRFAERSLRYDVAWSDAPVCAPARTALISGLYPTATGTEHMRSQRRLPAAIDLYPTLMRRAGYYCTNNSKEDYNLETPADLWDESSPRAHWKNRPPDRPFFAIFNLMVTHESGIRRRPHTPVHDPERVPVPPYHPDTPEVRRDWAQYYDNITAMDGEVGARLRELEEAGLAESTIVFYYSDHGSGMPRSKRWPYNSGLQVPLLVHVPERFRRLAPVEYRPSGHTRRPVAFVDMAPTLLSLAGVRSPAYLHGGAFLGRHEAPARRYLFGFRGRMDERYDLVRSVRDDRFVYIRNYMPHRIYGQHIAYMFETPTTQVWRRLHDEGRLNREQSAFWRTKPAEELYDLREDPHEVVNLAESRRHRAVLRRLRAAHRQHALRVRDLGFLPEPEIARLAGNATAYELAQDNRRYPLSRILAAAELATGPNRAPAGVLANLLDDPHVAIRYWGATGLLIGGEQAVTASAPALRRALDDPSPSTRAVAAEALGRWGTPADREAARTALAGLLETGDLFTRLMALAAVEALGVEAAPLRPVLRSLLVPDAAAPARLREYVLALAGRLVGP